ncbi:sulfatase-like hydrolase/transferase [Phycicoccus flavus]|uniref:sulfatase-like hydrolase/transferase n=1 Tax=Phycicoccus flavus TaxID=2502783 RepID=UPI000FEBFBA1|nr:sulfatase-like hydrolase/transferase [Phycicoccus flavus]NHA67163.1 sulfatase-like hydrolase/transferase [Phycicoccus flavus]
MPDAPDRPNIVWLVSEDCSPHGRELGDGLARTPTIDRLAHEGVVFENMFTTYPVCAPARFAILTGAPAQSHGSHQMRSVPHLDRSLRTYPEVMRAAGYFCTNNPKTDYNCDVDPAVIWDGDGTSGDWRDRPDDRPFLAVFNANATHESTLWRTEIGPVDPSAVRVPPYLPDTPEVRGDIARYYTAVEQTDARFAEIMGALSADGLADDTVVLYSSDHGGCAPWTKRYCHDQGLRVPLVMWAPPRWQHLLPAEPGTRLTEPVTHLDVTPTIVTLGGAPAPATMRGRALVGRSRTAHQYAFGARDRMDERYDLVRTVRDERYRLLRNYLPHRPSGQHQAFAWQAAGYRSWETELRAGRLDPVQRRFFEPRPGVELYDCVEDPDHLVDLAGDPEHAERVATMQAALDEWVLDCRDRGFVPEGSPLADGALGADVYPLAEVLALATACSDQDPAHLSRFVAALEDDREVVRFWAAQGMLALGVDAAPALGVLGRTVLDDPSPHVRVPAAELLARIGNPDVAVAVLGELAAPGEHPRVRLQAVNALTYVGEVAMAALDVVDLAATQTEDRYLRNAGRYLAAVLRGTYTPETAVFDRAS